MRILIICGAGYISGKEKVMFSLLKGFAKEEIIVNCITSTWGNGQFENLLVSEKISFSKVRLGFISKTLNWKAIRMTIEQAFYWPKLLYDYCKIIAAFKPDVVIHSNFHHLFLLYPVINSKKEIHIYHCHESINNSKFYKKLFRYFSNKITKFIGVSDFVSKRMVELGIKESKVKTIHNGLEIGVQAQEFKQGIESEIFKVGIVGQIVPWKGHECLFEAIRILKNAISPEQIRISVFGNGDEVFVKKLQSILEQRKISEYVIWEGFKNKLTDIYKDLDLVCLPTLSEEPFGLSAIEPGIFAIPVIVTKQGGLPEIVEHGYNGFVIDSSNADQLAHYILQLINKKELSKEMGKNHQKVVFQKFTFQQFMENWMLLVSENITNRN